MNRYEMGVVVRADLEEDNFRAEMERVKGLIDRFGGTIDRVDEWGRRKLAYPINKLTEGVYTFITYSAEGGTPKEVESRIRLMENVLRFLTIRKDETEPLGPANPPTPPPKPVDSEEKQEPAEPAEAAKDEAVADAIVETAEDPAAPSEDAAE